MISIVLREVSVLFFGVAVAYAASLFGNPARDFGALVATILVPIAFCLARAALAPTASPYVSSARYVAHQVAFGLALVSLLLFEMGAAVVAGVADVPLGAWAIVVPFGAGYVCLFCVTEQIGLSRVGPSIRAPEVFCNGEG